MENYNWDYDYDSYDDNLGYYDAPEPDYSYLGNFGFGYGNEVYEIPNPAQEGQEGYGWRYFTDGTVIGPDNSYYAPNAEGDYRTPFWSPSEGVSSLLSKLGSVFKTDGKTDWRKVSAAAAGIASATGLGGSFTRARNTQPTGYQGGIPKYTAIREAVQNTYDPERRPGSSGQRYFSDTRFAKAGEEEAARTAAQEEVAGLAALNESNVARQKRPSARAEETAVEQVAAAEDRPASEVIKDLPVPNYAAGGIAGLKQGRYLNGATDGMADKIPASIENKQPAALSHGEFVIPADVVSHLGNGNSEAGAKKLYEMMDKIRQARTGTKKQGKQINPNKYMPA